MSKSKWLATMSTTALAALACTTPADAALVVSNGATTNVNCAPGVCSATAADAVMNVKKLRKMLGKADVELSSKNAMTDVVFQDAMSWSSARALGVESFKAVVFNNHLVSEGGGKLWLSLNDGNGGDVPTVGPKGKVEFWDLSSQFLINGNGYVLVGDIATLASTAKQFDNGFMALAKDYDAKRDGTYTSSPVPSTFNGRLEALGHTISNFKINSADGHVALFADLYANARIAHLHMEKANVTATLDSARVV